MGTKLVHATEECPHCHNLFSVARLVQHMNVCLRNPELLAALLVQLPGPERAIVRALLQLLARETPEERQFTLEVIERLLLPAQPHIIGSEPDEPAAGPESD